MIEANFDKYVDAGRYLCENLLEPLTELYGPSSTAAGLCPDCTSPHGWLGNTGMACDIAFHDWVNQDKPPFHLLAEIDSSDQRYERAISYAGSEFMCLSISPKGNRRALYENVRKPDEVKPTFVNYNTSRWSRVRQSGDFSALPRPDWRREDDEPVYHTRRSIRPQHIRVGQYFTLLDFMRNVDAFRQGHVIDQEITQGDLAPFRKVASVLDHAVRRIGRVSVYRGLNQMDGAGDYDWLTRREKRV